MGKDQRQKKRFSELPLIYYTKDCYGDFQKWECFKRMYQSNEAQIKLEMQYAELTYYAMIAEHLWLYFMECEGEIPTRHYQEVIDRSEVVIAAIDRISMLMKIPVYGRRSVPFDPLLPKLLKEWRNNHEATIRYYSQPDARPRFENIPKNLLI